MKGSIVRMKTVWEKTRIPGISQRRTKTFFPIRLQHGIEIFFKWPIMCGQIIFYPSVIGKSDDFFANVSLLFLNTHKISANNNVIINKCKNGIRRVEKN